MDAVVVHFADGRTLSGHAEAPSPGAAQFRVREASTGAEVTVALREVKVVCFVKSLATTGVIRHRESPPLFHPPEGARRVEIVFRDGERMAGTVTEPTPPDAGFFVTPLNPNGNNRKIYVNPAQVLSFRFVT